MERLICIAIGYACGLFQTAYILGKIYHIDIRKQGSGNLGSTNVLRTLGKKAGASLRWQAGLSSKDYGSNTYYSARFDDQFEHTLKTFLSLKGENRSGLLHFRPAIYWNHQEDRFELIRGSEAKVPYNYHRTEVFGLNLNAYFDWTLGSGLPVMPYP